MTFNVADVLCASVTDSSIDQHSLPSFQLPTGVHSRGVMLVDSDQRVTHADANIFRLLGVDAEILGMETQDIARTVLQGRFADPDAYESSCVWLKNNPTETLEDVLEMAGPEYRALHRYSAPLFDKDCNCLGRIEVYSDITKRRELEASARRAYDELKAAQQQLVQSEKLRAIGEIASGVAHDFNNTLGIILGNIQLLLRKLDDEDARSKLQSAEQAALDGVNTVRRIQEFAKTKLDSPTGVVNLNSAASVVVEMMRPIWKDSAHARGCHVEIALDVADDVLVQGSAPEIREVLINILLNAVQAMPDGGNIRISTGRSVSQSWIQVADNGTGMTEDTQSRIFDPFYTTRGVEGTGLGMSVAYGIIKRHGGSISIDSEPGKGSVITVFMPTGSDDAERTQPQPDSEELLVRQARILVVDDEEMFAEVLHEMLTECGHAVCVARSGPEAVERFRETPFDLVLTDFGMPQMSGLQVAKAIKDIDPQMPVALLTGWGTTLGGDDSERANVDMILSKPIKLDKLSSAVTEVLRRSDERQDKGTV